MIMTQKYRCDSCKKVFLIDELTEIIDSKGRSWCRCKNCIEKWGKKPRSNGYYTYIQFESTMGLEDPKKVIRYGPCKKHR